MNTDCNATGQLSLFSLDRIWPLIFGSGLCALVYQVVWLRELRLVFGASTAASSAVLAIFMGGLGAGGGILGKWVDRHPRPLHFYATLELSIALLAAVTPLMLDLVRHIYVYCGGSAALGIGLASLVRLALSALVLGAPTFLMGATLPAVAKAVVGPGDAGRRDLAWIYGVNTLGAVVGAVISSFFMLEIFGARKALWLACLTNLLIAMAARATSRHPNRVAITTVEELELRCVTGAQGVSNHPRSLIFAAAALVGFTFFIMEMVWYRTLAPLLGGSTYTFGLILAVALAGIGVGGMLYGTRRPSDPVSLRLLAWTIGLEAFLLILPFALGDRLAVLAALLTPLGSIGMPGKALAWTLITGGVIFPAAVVSGFQFPLLIGLLGRGGHDLGRDTGYAYAANTAGAIGGALAGGFGFLPLFTANGLWQASAGGLALLCLAAVAASWKLERRTGGLALCTVPALMAIGLIFCQGPTAAWRHSPIGAGRTDLVAMDRNQIRDWIHHQRRNLVWEAEGVEASVGLDQNNGLAFVVNGKIDGNAVGDAPTQVMLGLVGAALHPAPERSLVIGLGTGSSAGWLARVPTMQQVLVAELEPAIKTVAKACAPVNQNVMDNPKVSITIADAREVLLTSRAHYDLIVSEPSNPFRAGIASLYTREFYHAVRQRLTENGLFTQWVQAYEVDTQTVGTIYATLAGVFPFVETWQTQDRDLILIGSMHPIRVEVDRMRTRLAEEPFRSALLAAWSAIDLEGFLARHIAGPDFARRIASSAEVRGMVNTDDLMLIEFGFARTVGRFHLFDMGRMLAVAATLGLDRPQWTAGAVDPDRITQNRLVMSALRTSDFSVDPHLSAPMKALAEALKCFHQGDLSTCLAFWQESGIEARYPLEIAMVAEALADQGDMQAIAWVEKLKVFWPLEAAAIHARLMRRTGADAQCLADLTEVFTGLKTDPWVNPVIVQRAMHMALELAGSAPDMAEALYRLLAAPFSVNILEEFRKQTLLDIGSRIDFAHGAEAVARFEPHIPWRENFLRYRYECYQKTLNPLAGKAGKDLEAFLQNAAVSFDQAFGF